MRYLTERKEIAILARAVAVASPLARSRHMPDCARSMRVAHRSKCPSPAWRAAVVPHLIAAAGSGPLTLVNVGVNKGWVVQSFLERYKGAPSAAAWHRQLLPTIRPRAKACGLCSECEANASSAAPPRAPQLAVEVHAFDLLEANAALVRATLGSFGYAAPASTVTHAAVGNYTGVAYTRSARGSAGDEGASAKTSSQGPHRAQVPSLTLDGWAEQRRAGHTPRRHSSFGRISELTVDAEGWDALVLEGSRRLLAARAVDLLEFEYNEKGKWYVGLRDRRYLKAVLDELHGFGYGCFWQGGTELRRGRGPWLGLAGANGAAWCDVGERPFWSNLVCSWRPEVLATLRRVGEG